MRIVVDGAVDMSATFVSVGHILRQARQLVLHERRIVWLHGEPRTR